MVSFPMIRAIMRRVAYKSSISQHFFPLTSGMGALRPGIFRFGYEGGGPYLCMAISHGGGTLWEFCGDKAQLKLHKELHKCLNSSPALSQNKTTVALCKKEMLCCVKQSRMKHSQVLWASRERFSAHRTDRLVSSPSAASRTLYPDTQPPDESYLCSSVIITDINIR